MQASAGEILKQYVDLVRREPTVASCIRRLRNFALVDGFEFKEAQAALKPELKAKLEDAYSDLLAGSLEMMFVCGFVAFYTRKRDGLALPYLLPLGSFTWAVEEAPKGAVEVFRYKVTMLVGNIDDEDVTVLPFFAPTKLAEPLVSPMKHILEMFLQLQVFLRFKTHVAAHNSRKHLVMTERVDLKDQTTDGIMLLDEFRRYNVIGNHPAVSHQHRLQLRASGGQQRSTDSVNDANWHWLQTAFPEQESVDAKLLPPNTDTHELGEIRYEASDGEIEQYTKMVHMFFDLPPPSHSMGKAATAEMALLSREQFTNVRQLCDFLQRVACAAYCRCFKVDAGAVQCVIDPQSRLSINSCDDVKKLMEAEIMTPGDRFVIRNMFLHRGKRQRVV